MAAWRWIVLPYGATSGKRIVIDADNGVIYCYDEFDNLVIALGPDDLGTQAIRVRDADGNQIAMLVDSVLYLPILDFTAYVGGLGLTSQLYASADGVAGSTARVELHAQSQGPGAGANANLWIRSGSNDLTRRAEIAVDAPITVDGESWHAAALQGGWSTVGVTAFFAPGYRKGPDNRTELRGVMANGATAAGTTVFNVPAAYRPTKRVQLPVTLNAGTTLTGVVQVMEIGAANAGDVKIYGVPAANAVGLDGLSYPLDA